MAVHDWMLNARAPRMRVRRSKGRRASDRLPSLETLLVAGGIVAWAWCAFEVLRLVLR
jgi:hypothetical protein